MTGTLDDLPSLDLVNFQLFDWLGALAADERETLGHVLDTVRRLAVDDFLPCYRAADIDEPWLDADGVHIHPQIKAALGHYSELGLFGASFGEDLGGLGLSFTACLVIHAMLSAANVSVQGFAMLTIANARLIATFGTPAQVESFALPQIEGRWFGTMCLSETQAGSSLADIRTRATADGRDVHGERYRIVGNKMWISGGDQNISDNIVHLVLAKIVGEDGVLPDGSRGISLFIVPRTLPSGDRNDVLVAGLNHKMGNRGISNCLLNFGERDGAIGWRVGEAGQGLAQMFMMMNEARIGVGMAASTLAYRGYRQSLRYARDRVQGRSATVRGGAPIAIIDHPDVRRMLLQQKAYAEGALALCFFCGHLVDVGDDEAHALLALLTPVAKSWPSEFGLIANDLAIQVHGGYGYTRDFDVEQLWRDNRLNPIHEGTTGIQAIDLLGRKIIASDGRSLAMLRQRVADTATRASDVAEWQASALHLLAFWDDAAAVIDDLTRRGAPAAFDDATLFLRAFGHGIVAWLWLDQALAIATGSAIATADGTRAACRYFFEAELPQAATWMAIVGGHSSLVRDTSPAVFA